ncbi:MAG: 1-phosphofructokinase family hexose kinase [Sphingomonadales bacterium]|nr:1-phosphofructokinase family hexose kinase [Sphingomonadales bacterium]MDE2569241.1 1-phosphofructokinase family hexose kinase [Sphingomonadales bacterium]
MSSIATLTLNPAIDSACEADRVFPTHKVRTYGERYDPGGGGINVARLLARLGRTVDTVYLSGGASGSLLDELLALPGIVRHPVAIHDHTRLSLTVFERESGQEFRFVPEGPLLSGDEWRAALDRCAGLACEWLVASGSLPRGTPDEFLALLSQAVAARGVKVIVDCHGEPLKRALAAGGLFLVKPSLGEFEALTGHSFASPKDAGQAALDYVRAGSTRFFAVTMGHEGAVLAHEGGVLVRPGANVAVKSATGAGDSFVAGMLHAFADGASPAEALAWGMAAGTAAVMSAGTGLCQPEEIQPLLQHFR